MACGLFIGRRIGAAGSARNPLHPGHSTRKWTDSFGRAASGFAGPAIRSIPPWSTNIVIDGVKIKQLRMIPDERGWLMECLRSDDEVFIRFGQAYVTAVYGGVVKAWHYHKKQTDTFVVPHGMVKVALYDDREDSPTRGEVNEFFLGERNPILLQIPAGVYHGFKGVTPGESLVLNFPTEVYNRAEPDEFRIDPHDNDIPYDWARKDG